MPDQSPFKYVMRTINYLNMTIYVEPLSKGYSPTGLYWTQVKSRLTGLEVCFKVGQTKVKELKK
jgi:hypothetical protein